MLTEVDKSTLYAEAHAILHRVGQLLDELYRQHFADAGLAGYINGKCQIKKVDK